MASYNEPYYDTDPATKGYVDKIKGELDTTTEEISANRSRNFGSQPTPPYYINDTYMNGTAIYVCKTSRLYGNFISSDWELASNYDNTQSIVDGGITTTTGTFQVGDTNNTIKAGITAYGSGDSSVRLWAGNTLANRNSAPFRVTQAGYLYANNANIKGAIYADYGTIGGFTLDSTKLYSGSGSGRAGIGVTGSEYAFWAGGETSSTAPFHVGHDGSIVATKGTIGGCSINNGVLSIANANINSLTVDKITSGTNGANLTFNGNVTCKNLNANSGGTIGGFYIGSTSLSGNTSKGKMTIQRGSSSYVDFPTNGGRLMLSSSATGGVALTSANKLVISDLYAEGSPDESDTKVALYSNNGWITANAKSSSSSYGAGIRLKHTTGSSVTSFIELADNINMNSDNNIYIQNAYISPGSSVLKSSTGAVGLRATGSSFCWATSGDGSINGIIKTTAGDASSRILKKDIRGFIKDDYDKALDLLSNINIYEYKYKYGNPNNETNFGFIIDDVEKLQNVDKFFKFEETVSKITEDNTLDGVEGEKYLNSDDIPDGYVKFKYYDETMLNKYLLTCIKALQEKINKLEERIVELEGGK